MKPGPAEARNPARGRAALDGAFSGKEHCARSRDLGSGSGLPFTRVELGQATNHPFVYKMGRLGHMTAKILPTLTFRSVVLTLWHVLELLGGVVKTQVAGPQPRASSSVGLGSDLYFYRVLDDAEAAGSGTTLAAH